MLFYYPDYVQKYYFFLLRHTFVDEKENTSHSHVINKNGDFVIRGEESNISNFFDRVENDFKDMLI